MFTQYILITKIFLLYDCRQDLDPCKAELTILGKTIKASESINHLYGKTLPESGSLFIGGFSNPYGANQVFMMMF